MRRTRWPRVAFGAGAAAVVAVLLVVSSGLAGASVSNAFPWPGSPVPPSSSNLVGECNIKIFAHNAGATAALGFDLQLGCQAMIPTGATFADAVPYMPLAGDNEVYSSFGPGWGRQTFSSGGTLPIGPFGLLPSCAAAVTSGGNSPAIYEDPRGYAISAGYTPACGPVGASTCGDGVGTLLFPEASSALYGSPGGAECGNTESAISTTQVETASLGPAEAASDGMSYESLQFVENVQDDVSPTCTGCGGTLGADNGTPFVPWTSSTDTSAWPATCAGFNSSEVNDEVYRGTSMSALMLPRIQFTNSIGSGYAGTYTYYLGVDSFSCGAGSGQTHGSFAGALPPTFFTGGTGSLPIEPCTLISANGPPADTILQAGKSYVYNFTYEGPATTIVVDPLSGAADTVPLSGTPTGYVGTDATFAPATGSPQSVSVKPTGTMGSDPEFWCVYAGVTYSWGDEDGSQPVGAGDGCLDGIGVGCAPPSAGGDLSQCFSASGWSLFDPGSWVIGSIKDALCVVEWAVIPSGSVLSGSAWASPFTGHVPGMWVGDAVDAVGTMFDGVNTGLAAGACTAPAIGATLPGGHPFAVQLPEPASCSGQTSGAAHVGSVFGYRSVFRTLLVFLVWFAVFAVVWRMLPWSKPGDGVEMLEGSGLNLDGDYVPTIWTNEGSD